MPTIQHRHLLFSGRPLKPDLFEFRANLGVYEDAGTDPAEDTDPVYQWNDQGPRSRFATQATLANRPSLSSTAIPNYLAFDGSDDRMTFGGTDVLASTTSPWSFEAYVRLTDFASTQYPTIFSLRSNATDPLSIAFSNAVGYLGLHFGSNATWSRQKTDFAAASLTGFDKHIVVTYNGRGATTAAFFKVYIDGVLQTLTDAAAFPAIANSSSIGSKSDNSHPFKGRIYRAAGFSRELTQAQVNARFALGVTG